jgi:hypothetical protein
MTKARAFRGFRFPAEVILWVCSARLTTGPIASMPPGESSRDGRITASPACKAIRRAG